MQPNQGGQDPNQFYTPEQMQQWQQSGMPPQMTPDMMQQMWMDQQQWQQMPPTIPLQQMTPEQIQQMQYEAYVWQAQQMQAQQQMPPIQPTIVNHSGARPKRPKPPRRKGPVKRALLAFVVVALLGGGVYLWVQGALNARATTAVVERGTMGTSYAGDALIVRNETAFDEEGVQSIDYVAQEGSVVYRGDRLCYVYSTGYSTAEMTALQDYRDQINDYQQTLLAGETSYDQRMDRLETEVIERGLEVRSLVHGARGNLINQEQILETAITQRQSYFRTKYATDMRLNRLYDDENTQKQRIESWITPKFASQESIVSFYTDGFEYALSPTAFENYTPAQVRSMINGVKPEVSTVTRGRTDLYRLIKKDNYAVLMLLKDNNFTPKDGDTYKLVLEQFSTTVVDAQVLSSTRSGGELLVRLAVLGDVSEVLYMRTCQAQLGEYVDCMVVPESAMYTFNDSQGVVVLRDNQQFFVPVRILGQQGGKAYVAAIQTGLLSEGMVVQLYH